MKLQTTILTSLFVFALSSACGGYDPSSSAEQSSAILTTDEEIELEPAEKKKIKFINNSSVNVTVKYKKGGETVEAVVRAGTMAPTEEYDGGDVEFSPSDQVEATEETKDGVRRITFKDKSLTETPAPIETATLGD